MDFPFRERPNVLFAPGLRNCPWVRIAEQGDLNEIYRRTFCDTTLCEPIEGNWYIEPDHEN